MLYLFAGAPRDGDIRWQLEQLCKQHRVSLDMTEFDFVRDPLQDLASPELWDAILKDCHAGAFDVAVLSPPCNTFSRARWKFSGRFGPRPLRSSHFPKGFPWLRDHDRKLSNLGNYFFEQSLQVAAAVCAKGGFFLLEHPEQLGRVATGDIPGSAWDWPEVRDFVQSSGAACWALHQCLFGAETSKPTRFASNLPAAQAFGVHWHSLRDDGTYAGPLGQCPHSHDFNLIGFSDGWRTAAAAAYPPELCKYLAFLIFSAMSGLQATVAAHADESLDIPHPAEAFALTVEGFPTAAQVMILFDLLPKTRPHAKAGLLPGAAFFAGAVRGSDGMQTRPTTRQFPLAVQKICQFIRAADSGHPFASFVILRNVHSALHQDHNNSAAPNLLLPITAFEGGGVWIQDETGQDFRWHQGTLVAGHPHSFTDGPIYLPARDRLHETLPWSGDRAIVAAYTPAGLDALSAADVQFLESLGFCWQSATPPLEGGPGLPSLPEPELSLGSSSSSKGCSSLPIPEPSLGSSSSSKVCSSLPEPKPSLGSSSPSSKGCSLAKVDRALGDPAVESFDPGTSRAFGQPMICRYEMGKKEFTDGFGLCSPGRWPPEAREMLASPDEAGHAKAIRGILKDFVCDEIKDLRATAFRLATGKLEESPFSGPALERVRKKIAVVLGDPPGALEVPEGQPFFLHLLARSLRVLGDPDFGILVNGEECFATGVPVGYDAPLPRAPQVFRAREKFRKLDETEFEPQMENYSSAEMSCDQLEAHFREDERKGMMVASTEGRIRQEFGADRLLVAAMGALQKPNGEIRPLFDGTHGIRLNNTIVIEDRLEVPGPPEVVEMVARARETREASFAISADISQAHRRVKIRRKDWPLLACKSSSSSKVVWMNKVGTFGVSSAAIWWTRLFGTVGRWVLRVLGPLWNLQVVYVDDLHIILVGQDKFLVLWMALAAYELVGTPFAYHKFRGGLEVEFVGYCLSYKHSCAGISPKRTSWVMCWIDEVKGNNWFVQGRRLHEFLGRLNFVARVLTWIKPFLSPIFAFNAVLRKGTVARLPEMVHLSLLFIREQLELSQGMQSVLQEWKAPREAFRADAKCEQGRVVLGGWLLGSDCDPSSAPWFSLEILPGDMPFLFDGGGESSWASTSAELLSSLAALQAFGFLESPMPGAVDCLRVCVVGGTDNSATDALSKKNMTTKWPLLGVHMACSAALHRVNKRLSLQWRPRDENSLADALTNGDFSAFSLGRRVQLSVEELPLDMLHHLAAAREDFVSARSTLTRLAEAEGWDKGMSKKQKRESSTPW